MIAEFIVGLTGVLLSLFASTEASRRLEAQLRVTCERLDRFRMTARNSKVFRDFGCVGGVIGVLVVLAVAAWVIYGDGAEVLGPWLLVAAILIGLPTLWIAVAEGKEPWSWLALPDALFVVAMVKVFTLIPYATLLGLVFTLKVVNGYPRSIWNSIGIFLGLTSLILFLRSCR